MSQQIIDFIKEKIKSVESDDAFALRNIAKEELQYYVLNFLYHHPVYSQWIMYGGSALRICHNLDRMSVDLDFEIKEKITDTFLERLKKEIEEYFFKDYNFSPPEFKIKINSTRGLCLKFFIGDKIGLIHPSKQIHVKIDLNTFFIPEAVTERIPINHNQLSFVIKAYNLSNLMASKIAAVLLRGQRGAGQKTYNEKGRDIYDLLWYMKKGIIPDLNYLKAKAPGMSNLRKVFDSLTLQINKVSDENLEQDLKPLFLDQNYIKNWLANWRESYFYYLKKNYPIKTVADLQSIEVSRDFSTKNYFINFIYRANENETFSIIYKISAFWFKFAEGNIDIKIKQSLLPLIVVRDSKLLTERLKRFITLFEEKNRAYLKRMENIVLGDEIETKLIRMSADNFSFDDHIVLNRSTLLSSRLEGLLK